MIYIRGNEKKLNSDARRIIGKERERSKERKRESKKERIKKMCVNDT